MTRAVSTGPRSTRCGGRARRVGLSVAPSMRPRSRPCARWPPRRCGSRSPPAHLKESVDLFRIGSARSNANPDGIDFSGPMFEALALSGTIHPRGGAGQIRRWPSRAGRCKAVFANARLRDGASVAGHSGQHTRRSDRSRGGLDAAQPCCDGAWGWGCNRSARRLQEYPEMAGPYAAIHRMLAPDGGTVQMLARVGYGPAVPASPRWPWRPGSRNG